MCAHIGGGAHFDAGDDAHGEERRQDGAAAVAQKRQGQTDDREQAKADADVDEDMDSSIEAMPMQMRRFSNPETSCRP